MNKAQKINSPNDRDRILRFIRRFCKPETCRALQFEKFISEIGSRESAEKVLKELWQNGLVQPTNAEIDPEDGALFEVPMPTIEDPIKDSTQFVLSDLGYKTIDPLFDPFTEYSITTDPPELYVPENIIIATEFINERLMENSKKIPKRCSLYLLDSLKSWLQNCSIERDLMLN